MLNARFARYLEALPLLTERLRSSRPLSNDEITQCTSPGLYSFSEDGVVLYIGRTKNFRNRHKNHCDEKSGENTAAFAFLLARKTTGNTNPTYAKKGSRKSLMEDPNFLSAFVEAKHRIRKMQVRFVEVNDPELQHLLELYASIELQSVHNKFHTS